MRATDEQRRPMTLTQKILAHHAVGLPRPWVEAGDTLQIRVDWTIASELAWNGMDRTYTLLGRPELADPDRFYLALDHTVDPGTLANDPRARKLADLSRAFAREKGLKHFYDANVTIMHTKFYRELVQPGEVVLGADSHTSSHGGLGAVAIGLGGADVTTAMVLGQTWLEVPEAIAVEYTGAPDFGIGGKDIILRTLGVLGRNTVAMERTVEYRGAAAHTFSTDMRFTICNMTAEFGGLNGIFEPDAIVAEWLTRRRRGYNDSARYFRADDDAPYVAHYPIALAGLAPQVARPFSPDNVFDVDALVGQPLDGVFIGACTTTEEELALAALVLEAALAAGQEPRPVASERRIVVPGDLIIEANLREHGLWAIYERAGFVVDPPGCSMCLGIASRKAGKGEVWLSSQNRNFENRMGAAGLARQRRDRGRERARHGRDRSARAAGACGPRPARPDSQARAPAHPPRHPHDRAGDAFRPAADRRTHRGGERRRHGAWPGATLWRRGGHRCHHSWRVLPPHYARRPRAVLLPLRAPGLRRASPRGRDHRGGRRGLGKRQLTRASRLGAARRWHPGDHRQKLRLHPQAEPGE
jgi:homoaconitase/3-isopropylmalate dehydratase large subunit